MSVDTVGTVETVSNLVAKTANGDARASERTNGLSNEHAKYAVRSHAEAPKSDTKPVSDAATYRRTTAIKAQDGDLVTCAGVKLKGTISSCNVLTVEGEIDATVQARQLVVMNGGALVGKAEVEEADIGGRFEGTLHASGKLVVRRTGRVIGQITYGQIEVEPGGELRGNISVQLGNRKTGLFSMPGQGRF